MKNLFVIILYNKKLNASNSYISLKPQVGVDDKILVFDNSTIKFDQEIDPSIMYRQAKENLGLSKAYNSVRKICEDFYFEYVVILDDDSHLSEDYVQTLNSQKHLFKDLNFSEIYSNSGQLLAPDYHNCNQLTEYLVKKGQFAFSKCKFYQNNLYGINSGMIISRDYFIKNQYDEGLFVDCVDWQYILDYKRAGNKAFTSKCRIIQEFHSETMDIAEFDVLVRRLKNRLKDLKHYNSKVYQINKFFIVTMYSIKTKSFKFFKTFY